MEQKNIILIDKSVNDCYFIANSTNTDTFPIMYSEKSTKQEILNTLTKFTSINRLGILFVSKPSINLFLDDKPFNNVENVDFIIAILKEFNVNLVNLIADGNCSCIHSPQIVVPSTVVFVADGIVLVVLNAANPFQLVAYAVQPVNVSV